VAYWRAMGVFERRYVKDDRRHQSDDTRIALWVKHTRLPIYMTAPCLVEHVAPADSLIGHNNRKRVATWLADGSPIDWMSGTIWGGRCSKGDPAWLNDEGRRLFGG
jgi:hypothetical protein